MVADYAYLQAGLIEAGVCLLAYFIVFWDHNIKASELKNFGMDKYGTRTLSSKWQQDIIMDTVMDADA